VIERAQYMHVSEETPTRGLRIDLPQGTWFVHEVVATSSEDKSSQLLGSEPLLQLGTGSPLDQPLT
jgi:hypothetical protein